MANLANLSRVQAWSHFSRFLLIGNERGAYATSPPDMRTPLTLGVDPCLRDDGIRAVRLAAHILMSNRPARPEGALLTLAKAVREGDPATRREALALIPVAVRSGSQLFQLVDYMGDPTGWAPELRAAMGAWYAQRPASELVNAVLKSPRDACWNHREVLGLADTKPPTKAHETVYRWITQRSLSGDQLDGPGVELITAHRLLLTTNSEAVVAALVRRWPQLRDDVPARWLAFPSVLKQMLPDMSTDGLVGWLPRLARDHGLPAEGEVVAMIARRLQLGALGAGPASSVAALSALAALRARAPGTLEDTVLALFHDRLRATRKSVDTLVIAIDPAASPDRQRGLSPQLAFAGLALMAAATARQVHLLAFGDDLIPIDLAPGERVDTLIAKLEAVAPGPPDGVTPIDWAVRQGVAADAFLVLAGTRPDPNAGPPESAFTRYRAQRREHATWLAVSTGAEPLCPTAPIDLNMLEVQGLDPGALALIISLIGETA